MISPAEMFEIITGHKWPYATEHRSDAFQTLIISVVLIGAAWNHTKIVTGFILSLVIFHWLAYVIDDFRCERNIIPNRRDNVRNQSNRSDRCTEEEKEQKGL